MGRATVAPVCVVKTGPDFAREVPEGKLTRYVGEKSVAALLAPLAAIKSNEAS